MIKRATLTGITMSIIIVFAVFTGMYLWFNYNAVNSGVTLDSKYQSVYDNLTVEQRSLESTITNIRDAASNITEPESVYQVAMNGLKGLLSVLSLPFKIVDNAVSSYLSINTLIEIPLWAKTLAVLGIVTIIIFVIVAILKGEAKF